MKAVVTRAAGQLTVEDVDVEPPRAGEVLVRIAASGVCGSDLHVLHGRSPVAQFPSVLGHEGAGVVAEVGSGVTSVTPGDCVVVALYGPCLACRHCLAGDPVNCDGLARTSAITGRMSDGSTRLSSGGEQLFPFVGAGTLAEYVVVRASQLVPVDPDAPLDVVCLAGCGVTTGLGAIFNVAAVRAGETVAVVGCGGVGGIFGAAAGTLKQLHFELGGKSPNIVFADADLDAATLGLTRTGVFTPNAGQSCIAGSRMLVQRPVFDEVVERIAKVAAELVVGDPSNQSTDIGAIVSPEQLTRVSSFLDEGRRDPRLSLLFGGRTTADLFAADSPLAGGWYVEPTLFRATGNESRVASEEIFGPVAVVIPFDTEEEAVAIANGTPYGLAAGVWTSDLKRAHRLVRDLQSGNVWVNAYARIHWALPFGGTKESGFGKDSGWESVLENTKIKTAWIDLS